MSKHEKDPMSFQEKRNLLYLLDSLIIFSAYAVYVFQAHQDGRLEAINWGRAILLLIPLHLVVNVVTQVIFIIINRLTTNEEEPTFADEFDQSIELRATRNSFGVFMVGFLLALGSVAGEMPLYVMFNGFVAAFFASALAWTLTSLYFYRRGL